MVSLFFASFALMSFFGTYINRRSTISGGKSAFPGKLDDRNVALAEMRSVIENVFLSNESAVQVRRIQHDVSTTLALGFPLYIHRMPNLSTRTRSH